MRVTIWIGCASIQKRAVHAMCSPRIQCNFRSEPDLRQIAILQAFSSQACSSQPLRLPRPKRFDRNRVPLVGVVRPRPKARSRIPLV